MSLQSVVLLSSDKVIRLAVGFFVHAYLARFLGPAGFGELSFVVNLCFIFYPLVALGLNDLTLRELSHDSTGEDRSAHLGLILGLRLLAGIICWALLILVLWSTGKSLVYFFYGIILLLHSGTLLELALLAQGRQHQIFLSRTTGYLVGVAAKLWGILQKFGVEFFLFANILEELVAKTMLLHQFRRMYKTDTIRLKLQGMLSLLGRSWPLMIVTFLPLVELRLGFFFFERFTDSKTLGLFSTAFTLLELCSFIPVSIVLSSQVRLNQSALGEGEEFEHLAQKLIKACLWTSIALVVGFSLVGGWITRVVYGEGFAGAERMLTMLSLVTLVSYFNLARGKIYIALDKTYEWLRVLLVAFLCYVLILVVGREHFDIELLVFGYLAAHLLVNAVFAWFDPLCRQTLRFALKGASLF